jgi:hypothetical protein
MEHRSPRLARLDDVAAHADLERELAAGRDSRLVG